MPHVENGIYVLNIFLIFYRRYINSLQEANSLTASYINTLIVRCGLTRLNQCGTNFHENCKISPKFGNMYSCENSTFLYSYSPSRHKA